MADSEGIVAFDSEKALASYSSTPVPTPYSSSSVEPASIIDSRDTQPDAMVTPLRTLLFSLLNLFLTFV